MLTFLHGADFHLDAPFRSLQPEQAAARRGEQRLLLRRLADAARDYQADLILLAGDLLDGDRVYYETAEALRETLGSIPARIFIAPGNHDPYVPGQSLYNRLAWPENVHIFRSPAVESIPVPELGCVVHGCAFCERHRTDSPLAGFSAPADGALHLGCFHGDLDSPGSRYGPLSAEEIRGSNLDYLALGHVHGRSGLRRAGKTLYAYPGCPEGRGFDETGDKGILLGRMENGTVSMDFLPLGGRRYWELPLDVTGISPADAVEALLPRLSSRDSYRLILTGTCEEVEEASLLALAAPHCFSVALLDRTRPPEDLWARRTEDTLTGLFLRTLRDRLDRATPEELPVLERALRFGLAALEEREAPR